MRRGLAGGPGLGSQVECLPGESGAWFSHQRWGKKAIYKNNCREEATKEKISSNTVRLVLMKAPLCHGYILLKMPEAVAAILDYEAKLTDLKNKNKKITAEDGEDLF